jgi:LDH2 family malate/lactate/ureidoglycolate dehydrogenase
MGPLSRLNLSTEAIDRFCRATLLAVGADNPTADAATRAMMHATRLGVDSHGLRLLPHYIKGLVGGRLNPRPNVTIISSLGAVASLDADDAHGALAAYRAMEHAVDLADQFGVGAVAIRNSSHFGPAGAYPLEAARRGFIGVAVGHSDSFVRLHDGAMRFHGTNPIACAVPVKGNNPWLLDMATSSVPYNRVQLYRSLNKPLPAGVASDGQGHDVTDPTFAEMLAPLGGAFGFKGAALAGLVTILSSALTGMPLDFDLYPMGGPDFSKPRGLGAFVLALKPSAFIDAAQFDGTIGRYMEAISRSARGEGMTVIAPGGREWKTATIRDRDGVELDPETASALLELSQRLDVTF